jgi:hypothetical protein
MSVTPMAYSTANWHWKNKTVTPWAREWFERELVTIQVEGPDGAVVSVERVVEVDGDVEVGRRKSKYVRQISRQSFLRHREDAHSFTFLEARCGDNAADIYTPAGLSLYMTARSSWIGRVGLRTARRPRGGLRSPRSRTRSRSMAFRITSYVLRFTPVVNGGFTETSEKSTNGLSRRSLHRRPRHSLRSRRRSSRQPSRRNLPCSQSS